MRRRFSFFALTGCFLGCNAILGIESGEFEPLLPEAEAGADSAFDGPNDTDRSDGTVTTSETGASDARPDVHAPDADADAPDVDASDADAGPGCDADLQNDPKSCGICGRDCLAGLCAAGVCQPYVVADLNADDLGSLAITEGNSDTTLVWTNTTTKQLQTANGTIANAPVETILTIAPESFSSSFSIAGDQIYFGQTVTDADATKTKHRVARVPVGDREKGFETIADGLAVPVNGVAADSATNIVWNELNPGTVRRCDTIPCGAPVVVGTDTFVLHLAIGGNRIAWTTLGTKLVQVSTGGASAETVSTGSNSVAAVLLLADSVVYSDLSRGVILVNLTTHTEKPLSVATNVMSIAVDPDAKTLWYLDLSTSVGQSTLARVSSVDGLPPVTATMALGAPRALAVDARRLYWLDTIAGHDRVMALAK